MRFWLPVVVATTAGFLVAGLSLRLVVFSTTAVFVLLLLLAIFLNPLLGLALALAAGPLGALENIILTQTIGRALPLDSGQILLLLTLAAWLGRGLARRRVRFPAVFLPLPLLGFLFVMGLTVLDAPSLTLGLKELLKWAEMVLIIWLVADLATETPLHKPSVSPLEQQQRLSQVGRWLLAAILGAGFIQAAVGIWQFGLRGHGPEHFLVLGRFYRAYGSFEQPNPFGGYVALTGLLALGGVVGLGTFWWQQWRREENAPLTSRFGLTSWWVSLLILLTAVACSLAVVMSWSRGAWLGFAAGLGMLVLFWPRKLWQGFAVTAVVAGLLLIAWQADFIPVSISSRLTSFVADFQLGDVRGVDINDTNYSVLERLAFWQTAVRMAEAEPWLGVGFGNYAAVYDKYALINWTTPLGHAHNYYLNQLAETGLIGFLAYLLLWLVILWHNVRLGRRLPWPERGLALGLLAAWTALTVHQLVDKLYVNNIYVQIGAMLALQQILANELRKQ
ncbi:MAG: O-antigen ligase family protein [Anaerolineales bacterium]|nr:O-antigen ligase family protein [Anaerolineales bacterium]